MKYHCGLPRVLVELFPGVLSPDDLGVRALRDGEKFGIWWIPAREGIWRRQAEKKGIVPS